MCNGCAVCVTLGDDPEHSFVGTGFVNGFNESQTFPDMPMFLVEGGSAFVAKIAYNATQMTVEYDQVLDDSQVSFRRFQVRSIAPLCQSCTALIKNVGGGGGGFLRKLMGGGGFL